MNRICIFCGRSFEPYPTVPNQQCCSRPECQKARRRKWQKEKLATDEAYRANQADCLKCSPLSRQKWIKNKIEFLSSLLTK